MIIFGTKGYLYQLAIVTLVCGQCGNPAAHTLRKRVTKFTLFFVPLFPFSTKYGTQCTFCGAESQLNQQQADALQAQAVTGGAVPGGAPGHGAQGGAPGYGGPQQANPFASGNPFQQGGGPGQSGNPYQR